MSLANPLWGALRIHGELLKLGIEVSQATVGRYLPWRPKISSPTWRSFLHNYLTDIAAIDMFVVATATFQLLYALIVLGHDRRRIIHFDVTPNPTQAWLSSQMTEAFPWDTALAATIPHPRLKGLGRSSPFSHAPFDIFEVVVHLLKRESEREEAFRHVAGKTSREAVATEHDDLGGIGIKSRFHCIERRRTPTRQQRGPSRAQVIGEGHAGMCQRRFEPHREGLGQRTDGHSSDHHKVVAQPEQRAQQRPRVGPHGETCRPLALGFGAQHIQLHQSPTDAVLNAVERIHIETLCQARKQFAKSPRYLIKCAGGRPSDQWMGV